MTERRELAVATDTELAATHTELAKATKTVAWKLDAVHEAAGDKHQGRWNGPWGMTHEEALATETSDWEDWKARNFANKLAEYEGAVDKESALWAEVFRLEGVWADNGKWKRYFLVSNTNGHVHRGMDCSTCYPTTEYGWLVELADCDEAEMVAEYGEMACTVCFPDAPAMKGFGDGTSSLARYTAAEKEARAAEKAAKTAAKEAKAIYDPAGGPLKDDYNSTIKTEITARRNMSGALENHYIYGYTHHDYLAYATRMAEAISHKTGESVEDLLAATKTKVFKKHKRKEA